MSTVAALRTSGCTTAGICWPEVGHPPRSGSRPGKPGVVVRDLGYSGRFATAKEAVAESWRP
jgi:hypothetical protein